jgi:hypothetical protein
VTVSGGTLSLGAFNDTVNNLLLSSGNITGTGTLTASTYTFQGGTIGANLGTGTINATSGTTALNGTAAATTITLNGGNITLGSAARPGLGSQRHPYQRHAHAQRSGNNRQPDHGRRQPRRNWQHPHSVRVTIFKAAQSVRTSAPAR